MMTNENKRKIAEALVKSGGHCYTALRETGFGFWWGCLECFIGIENKNSCYKEEAFETAERWLEKNTEQKEFEF